jgi:hypothetical protein
MVLPEFAPKASAEILKVQGQKRVETERGIHSADCGVLRNKYKFRAPPALFGCAHVNDDPLHENGAAV